MTVSSPVLSVFTVHGVYFPAQSTQISTFRRQTHYILRIWKCILCNSVWQGVN